MPKIDITTVLEREGSGYPLPFDAPCAERARQRLGNVGRLTDFGGNFMRRPPGNWFGIGPPQNGLDRLRADEQILTSDLPSEVRPERRLSTIPTPGVLAISQSRGCDCPGLPRWTSWSWSPSSTHHHPDNNSRAGA